MLFIFLNAYLPTHVNKDELYCAAPFASASYETLTQLLDQKQK